MNATEKRNINRRFLKIGGAISFFCILAILLTLAANLAVSLIPDKLTDKDTSRDGYFSFTENTKELCSSLDKDVYIYSVGSYGTQDKYVAAAVDALCALNPRRLHNGGYAAKDSLLARNALAQESEDGSLIVKCGGIFRTVEYADLFPYGIDYENETVKVSFDFERNIYAAIAYTAGGTAVNTLGIVGGHGEGSFDESFTEELLKGNMTAADIKLTDELFGISTLLVTNPQTDLTDAETESLKAFLKGGGSLVLIYNPTSSSPLENIDGLLLGYGVCSCGGIILDMTSQDFPPYLIYPTLNENSPIKTASEGKDAPIFQFSSGIALAGNGADVTVTPIAQSSDGSYLRAFGSPQTDMAKTDADRPGPFTAAALLEHADGSKIVWIASEDFANSQLNSISGGSDYELVKNSALYLGGVAQSGSTPHHFGQDTLDIGDTALAALIFITVLLIPAIFFTCGFIVKKKRES